MSKKKLLSLYFIISLIWFFGTNYILDQFEPSTFILFINRIKEVLYIIASGLLFYYFMNRTEELNASREEEKRLSTLINSMVDFVNFKDGEGRWLEVNKFGLKLFDLEHVDYRGKTDSELAAYTEFYGDALRYCETSDEEAWKNGTITRVDEVIPMKDGTFKTFDSIKVPLYHKDGSRKGIVIIGRDITKLRQTEEKLIKTEKLSVVGELSASVAHEIRNPLTSLKGFVQLLQTEDEKHQFYYQIMQEELDRINHIVGELLLLAKPQEIKFTKTDVQTILFHVISLLNTEASLHNVQIEFKLKSNDAFIIECEPNQLKQLFINIIKNAIEASANGGTVTVSLKSENERVAVIVKDNGCGISKERLEKLGEPFYSSKEKGTGLGLTVSFKIVQSHNGTIQFNSDQNKGTEVVIELPEQKESLPLNVAEIEMTQ